MSESELRATRCETCRWWDRVEGWGSFARCRASPPAMGGSDVGVWPLTDRDSWCGRHTPAPKPKPEKALTP